MKNIFYVFCFVLITMNMILFGEKTLSAILIAPQDVDVELFDCRNNEASIQKNKNDIYKLNIQSNKHLKIELKDKSSNMHIINIDCNSENCNFSENNYCASIFVRRVFKDSVLYIVINRFSSDDEYYKGFFERLVFTENVYEAAVNNPLMESNKKSCIDRNKKSLNKPLYKIAAKDMFCLDSGSTYRYPIRTLEELKKATTPPGSKNSSSEFTNGESNKSSQFIGYQSIEQ